MAEYLANKTAIKAAADAIREKTEKSATISWNKDKSYLDYFREVIKWL